MPLNVQLDLDDIWTGEEWSSTIGDLLRDELRAAIKAEIRSAIKKSPPLKKIIKKYQDRAIAEALEKLK